MEKIKLLYSPAKGEAYYTGESVCIFQRNYQSYFQVIVDKYIGQSARMMIYSAMSAVAKKRFCGIIKPSGSPERDMRLALSYLTTCGHGIFEIKKFGMETLIEVKNCSNPQGQKSEKPFCYFMAGTLGGLMELFTGKECICEEERCRAMGGNLCVFRITVSGKPAAREKACWTRRKSIPGTKEMSLGFDPHKGEVFFRGASSIIVSRPEQYTCLREFERILGPASGTLFYEGFGKTTAIDGVRQMRKTDRALIMLAKLISKKKITEKLAGQLSERGYGSGKLLEFDNRNKHIRISVRNCYNTIGYGKKKERVCYIMAGIVAGAASVVFGIDMDCEETKCTARGDPHCEFRAYPAK